MKHPCVRDRFITFQAHPHAYYVQRMPDNAGEEAASETPYMSVTTMKKLLFPEFDEDKVICRMRCNPAKWHKSKYYPMSPEQIKALWAKTRDEAADAGIYMHAHIEKFLNGSPYDAALPEMHLFSDFYSFMQSAIRDFLPYRTEWRIFHEQYQLAGTVDFVCKICGPTLRDGTDSSTYWLIDWKRTRAIEKDNRFATGIRPSTRNLPDANYWHYAVQLSLYAMILHECYGIDTRAQMWVVDLHPQHRVFQLHHMPYLAAVVADVKELRLEAMGRAAVSTTNDVELME
jgi:hypothetical protein